MENGQEFSLMSGERSFLNLFRDSRTPLDSMRDKLVTLICFVTVQCPSVGTTCTVGVVRGKVTHELRGI